MAKITIPEQQVGLPSSAGTVPVNLGDASIGGQVLSALGKEISAFGERIDSVSREATKNQAVAKLKVSWTDWQLANAVDPAGHGSLVENAETFLKRETANISGGIENTQARQEFQSAAAAFGVAKRNEMAVKAQTQKVQTALAETRDTVDMLKGQAAISETASEFGANLAALGNQYDIAIQTGLLTPVQAESEREAAMREATAANLDLKAEDIYASAQAGADVTAQVEDFTLRAQAGLGDDETTVTAVKDLLRDVEEATAIGIVGRRLDEGADAVGFIDDFMRTCKGPHCAGVGSKLMAQLSTANSLLTFENKRAVETRKLKQTQGEAEILPLYLEDRNVELEQKIKELQSDGAIDFKLARSLKQELEEGSRLSDNFPTLLDFNVNIANTTEVEILSTSLLTRQTKDRLLTRVRSMQDANIRSGHITINKRFGIVGAGQFASDEDKTLAARISEQFDDMHHSLPPGERTPEAIRRLLKEVLTIADQDIALGKLPNAREDVIIAEQNLRDASKTAKEGYKQLLMDRRQELQRLEEAAGVR